METFGLICRATGMGLSFIGIAIVIYAYIKYPPKKMKTFEQYHAENPDIWKQFVRYAHMAKYEKGFDNLSARDIFRAIRWHTKTSGNDGFKVNNNYSPDYARKLMKEQPDFDGFFYTRERKQNAPGNDLQ